MHNLSREIAALRTLDADMRGFAIVNALGRVSSKMNKHLKFVTPVDTGALRRSWGVGRVLKPRSGEIRTWVKVRSDFTYAKKRPVFYAEFVNSKHNMLFDRAFKSQQHPLTRELIREINIYIERYKRR